VDRQRLVHLDGGQPAIESMAREARVEGETRINAAIPRVEERADPAVVVGPGSEVSAAHDEVAARDAGGEGRVDGGEQEAAGIGHAAVLRLHDQIRGDVEAEGPRSSREDRQALWPGFARHLRVPTGS
jgi:hypothetical protein